MLETAGRDRVAYVIEENAVRGDDGALPSAWAFVDDGDGESVPGPGAGAVHGAATTSHPRQPEDARTSAAVLSLQVGYRLPVLFTRSVADTAELLVRIGMFLSRPRPVAHGTPYEAAACRASTATHSKKRENVDARQCFLQQLCQVPGVSHGIAVGIAATPGFGTMRDLARTLEALPAPKERSAALQKAPKVGKAIAERILQLFSFA
jgi:ERCC4-type nuclease